MTKVRIYEDPEECDEPVFVKLMEEGKGVALVTVDPGTGTFKARLLRIENCGVWIYRNNQDTGLPTDSHGRVRVILEDLRDGESSEVINDD